jgi:hypothetical protein
MKITCKDLDRLLQDGSPQAGRVLELHAVTCIHCAEALRAWKSISSAAKELGNRDDSPELWERIERALTDEIVRKSQKRSLPEGFQLRRFSLIGWQTALAAALVFILGISLTLVFRRSFEQPSVIEPSLLKTAALKEVEHAEAAYVQAIGKLADQAKPRLKNSTSALLVNYQEKLAVLDSAIADLRAETGLNPSNSQLRYQLLAMYQEKQHTLEEILEARKQ